MPPSPRAGGSARPVVLAPGLLCDDRLWAPVRAHLMAPSTVVDFRSCDSLEAMADVILDSITAPAVVAGFSMGGMAAILAAAQAPDRVAGLVIIDTHTETDTSERRTLRLDQLRLAGAQADFEQLIGGLPGAYWPTPSASQADLVVTMAMQQGRAVFARHVRAIMERPDLAAAACGLRLPVEIVCGREDRIAPPALAERMAGLIPGANPTVLDHCGHMAPLDQPKRLAEIIDSLASPA